MSYIYYCLFLLYFVTSSSISAQQINSTFECQDPPYFTQSESIYTDKPSFQMLLAQEMLAGQESDLSAMEDLTDLIVSINVAFDSKYSEEIIDGVRTIVFTPHHLKNNNRLLYIHGGAFRDDLILFQYEMILDIAINAGSKLYIPLYSVTEQAQFPVQINQIEAVFNSLHDKNPNQPIIVIGDSAGGNLALTLTAKLRDNGSTLPSKLIVLSPWVDLNHDNPNIANYIDLDKMLNLNELDNSANLYVGLENMHLKDNPYVSPLFIDSLGDFPETLLFISTSEIFYPDNELFIQKAKQQGMPLSTVVINGGFHVWLAGPKWLIPETRKSRRQIYSFINCSSSNEKLSDLFKSENMEELTIEAYPNPVNEHTVLRLNQKTMYDQTAFTIKIFNSIGSQIAQKHYDQNIETDILIGDLLSSQGLYFVHLKTDDAKFSATTKVIKY